MLTIKLDTGVEFELNVGTRIEVGERKYMLMQFTANGEQITLVFDDEVLYNRRLDKLYSY